MRKIWNKIRKIFASIGLALFSFGTKVMAITKTDLLYGPPNPDLYGVFKPQEEVFWEKALHILKLVFIPFILIIGLVIYWKKSKADKRNKIYFIIAIVGIVGLIYGMFYLIDYMNNL